MNIIKGIDRIALALAVVTLVGTFILGVTDLIDEKKPNPEYTKWKKEYSGRVDYLYERNPTIKPKPRASFLEKRYPDANRLPILGGFGSLIPDKKEQERLAVLQAVMEEDTILQNIKKREPPKFNDPPIVWVLGLSAAVALISSLIVLFGIRGLTRGTKIFSFWIIDGFKDEKKPKNNL